MTVVSPIKKRAESAAFTYLKIVGELVHLAAIFIVLAGILPYITEFFLESIPGLEIRNTRGRCSAVLTSGALLDAFYGHRMLDELVVVLQLPTWKINKRREDFEAAKNELARVRDVKMMCLAYSASACDKSSEIMICCASWNDFPSKL